MLTENQGFGLAAETTLGRLLQIIQRFVRVFWVCDNRLNVRVLVREINGGDDAMWLLGPGRFCRAMGRLWNSKPDLGCEISAQPMMTKWDIDLQQLTEPNKSK